MFKWLFNKNSKTNDNPIDDKDSLLFKIKDEDSFIHRASKKILVINDNVLGAKLLSALLEEHGCDTHHISDGHKALDVAYEFQPDLIVVDIQSRNISAFDVIQNIRTNLTFKDTPIILFSNPSITTDDKRWRDGSCDAYITQPMDVSLFLETIRQILWEYTK